MTTIERCNNIPYLITEYVFDSEEPNDKSDLHIEWENSLFEIFYPRLIETIRVRIFGDRGEPRAEFMPYIITRFFAEKHCEVFYETALINLDQPFDRDDTNYFLTACIHTICATSRIFFGKKTNKVLKGLQWTTHLPITLPCSSHMKSSMNRNILLKNVLTEGTSEQEVDALLDNLKLYVCRFNFDEECPASNYLGFVKNYFVGENYFLGESYIDERDFNWKALQSIQLQVLANKASPSKSIVHTFIIFGGNGSIHHAFQIENFFSSSKNQGMFRLIHSWGKVNTLIQNFSKQGFDQGDSGCWDLTKMEKFLGNFQNTYRLRNLKNHYFGTGPCFGYDGYAAPMPFGCSSEKNGSKTTDIFTASTIRHSACEINPADALLNAARFVLSSEALQALFV